MNMTRFTRGLGILAAVAMAGCKSLDIQNPNQPDARRALADPNALEAVTGGTMRTWMNTFENNPTTVLCTQANSCTASWNNDNMNFYSSLDDDGTRNQRPWQNDPSAAARTSIENYWFGFYSALSSANDVLKAIRQNGVVIGTASQTKRTETIAQLMQAANLAELSLNYDKGYIVFDSTDISNLVYSDRKAMRDAALKKFDATIALANANTFNTPTGWTNGISYDNTQIARIANTMAARLLAYWPRNLVENGQVNWGQVLAYTSKGMSTGAAFDFVFTGDGNAFYPEQLTWFDDMTSGRVHTRIAKMLDPVTQKDPWPDPGGNPPPNSPDKRLGNGTFGTADMIDGYGNIPKKAGAGTDFAFSSQASFRPSRGQYHQSNIAFVRWDCDGLDDANSIGYGFCPFPVVMAAQNDLLWAEALIRSGGDLGLAATLINKTRVTRGGLSAATAGEGAASLLTKLYYENEVELFALGATSYFNNRRLDLLLAGTPHEMPVPAKELGVFGQGLYTFGGTGLKNSPTPP
jgi:hypothetical protein